MDAISSRVICSILFVDRNWAYPHQPCARHATMSPSTVKPSLFLPPQSRSRCLCSTAGVELPQPVCELPSSRILKLFSPSPFHGSHLTEQLPTPPTNAQIPFCTALWIVCLLQYPLAVSDNDPVRVSNVESVNEGF